MRPNENYAEFFRPILSNSALIFMKMIEPGILFFVNAFVFGRGLTARVRPANFS
jgi:hypothetical protein